MIYSQFQQPFQQRFSGSKGWLAFAVGITVIALGLLALPFVLLFLAVGFIAVSLFGRFYIKPKMDQFKRQAEQAQYQQQGFTEEAEEVVNHSARFGDDSFKPRPHQGRIFEHDPNERV